MDEKIIAIAVLMIHYGDPNRPHSSVYILKQEFQQPHWLRQNSKASRSASELHINNASQTSILSEDFTEGIIADPMAHHNGRYLTAIQLSLGHAYHERSLSNECMEHSTNK